LGVFVWGNKKEIFSAIIYDKEAHNTLVHHIYMDDISGEDFTKYIGPDSDGKLPDYMNHLLDASSFILIINPETLDGDMWTFLSLMKYLVKVKGMRYGETFDEKFAIVLSKHDEHRDITDAREYLMTAAPDFYASLEIRVKPHNLEFFLTSAVGDLTPEGDPRLPLSPVGVVEVIEWVLGKQKLETPICATCRTNLRWVPKDNMWYCDVCKEYPQRIIRQERDNKITRTKSKLSKGVCSKCNGEARFIEKYNRWYCDNCKEYLPDDEDEKE
jgi:hypothetical protein